MQIIFTCSLVHVRMKVLLCAVERDELLVVVKLTGGAEVRQLVDDRPVVSDELHDVAGLQVSKKQNKKQNKIFSQERNRITGGHCFEN